MNTENGTSTADSLAFVAHMTNGKNREQDNYIRVAVKVSGKAPVLSQRYAKEAGIKVAIGTIRSWVRAKTMRNVSFEKVYWLARFSNMPMHLLTGTEDLCPKQRH